MKIFCITGRSLEKNFGFNWEWLNIKMIFTSAIDNFLILSEELTVVYTGFRGWGGVLFEIGEIKNFAFFQTRKFSKNDKKAMKN